MHLEQLPLLIGQKLFKIALFLIGGEIAKRAVSLLVKRIRTASQKLGQKALAQQQAKLKTTRSLIKNTAKLVINFIVFVMILSELGLNIAPLITGAGILGLAVGFGAKSLVSDLIAGFFIILENQFNIGDKVQIGTNKGKVIKISLRTVTLRDEERKIYIIPNSSIKYIIKFPKKK